MSSNDVIALVKKLNSTDCLVVSDFRGTRNINEGCFLYADDEIISGSIQVTLINNPDPDLELMLQENDVLMYYNI